jgi:outer membrane protein assembly factor BamB
MTKAVCGQNCFENRALNSLFYAHHKERRLPKMRRSALIILIAASLSMAYAENWPGWRGPGSLGISTAKGIAIQWDLSKNVKWKAEVPGLGHSSPIVWGNRIFVTTAVSSDPKEDNWQKGFFSGERKPDAAEISWEVLCFDRDTGRRLWERTAIRRKPVSARHTKNSYATPTPVTDGTYVIAFFGDQGMYCYDFQGKLIWSRNLGNFTIRNGWGLASSPVLYKSFVIQTCDQETGGSFIIAMDKKTGKTAWQTGRDELSSWSSPYLYLLGSRPELVINATRAIRSYDPENGKLLWECRGPATSITAPTATSSNGLIFVSSGFIRDEVRPVTAFHPGATGDVTLKEGETKSAAIAWRQLTAAPYIPSPTAYGDYLFVLLDQGFIACYEAKTGKEVYGRKRIDTGANFSASPVVVEGRLYCVSEDGDVYVIKAGAEYVLLAKNSIGEAVMASPAVSDGKMFIRALKHLYCIR